MMMMVMMMILIFVFHGKFKEFKRMKNDLTSQMLPNLSK